MEVAEGLDGRNMAGDVDERDDMDGELAEDGTDDVRVEDVGLRTLFGELFNRLEDVLVGLLR